MGPQDIVAIFERGLLRQFCMDVPYNLLLCVNFHLKGWKMENRWDYCVTELTYFIALDLENNR